MSSCPYEILGVPREAETSQIKKAYRKLARTCHPDVAPGQRDRFEAITNAYKVLSNDLYRRFYDQFRKDPLELGLDDKTIRRALFETRKRVSKEKVPRSQCEDCDGTGIRLSGRLCTSCDPALDKKPEPELPPDPRGEGERYRMRRPNPQRPERDAPVGLDDLMGTATVEVDAGAHKRMRLRRPKK